MESLESAAGIAAYQPEGIYASPCGTPKVYGDDDGNGTADWDDEVDGDVDVPSVNQPNGALTGVPDTHGHVGSGHSDSATRSTSTRFVTRDGAVSRRSRML